jgi:Flp pilus assembly protein TadG
MRRLLLQISEDGGAVVVMVALWLPVLAVTLTFVVDVGSWFVHKRHLQTQADAGALAAAQELRFPCTDGAITQKAADYSGDVYNAQIGGTPASRVHLLINSKTFYDQPTPADDTVESPPCSAGMIDVKLTETDMPWLFKPLAGVVPSSAVRFVNAHARVSSMQIDQSKGSLPVGVPDVNPRSARAYFVNEATNAVLGSVALTKAGTSNGLAVWDNASAPLSVAFASTAARVGVVIALGGVSNTTCGQSLVQCYDAGAATTTAGMPTAGILYLRGWSAAGSGAQPSAPLLRDVQLVPGTCADPYFSAATTSCTVAVQARADFGTDNPVTTVGAKLTARVGGTDYPLTYNATTTTWTSAATIPVSPNAGPLPVTLSWEETSGTVGSDTCTTKNGNKCKDAFESSNPVQRAFAATDPRSGPIQAAQVVENGVGWANSFERCSSVQTSCTHDLVVRIGVKGSLQNASEVGDPVVALRVVGGSQNQSLDCDPNVSKLKDELAGGCAPFYQRNTGATACPGSPSTLWATAQPWPCVAIQTGAATNQVPAGMNHRILGTEQPASCTAPNHWSQFPNLDPHDPRIVQLVVTPFGSFSGSGNSTVPVTDFATFYVTGWTASGNGFANPCEGQGDDPVPNGDAGYIVGHFIKYIQTLNTGGGTTPCDVNAFGACVAVLTR